MDYSNFVKNFYRYSFSELNKYKNYNGRIVQVGEGIDIPDEFLHVENNVNMFLPTFSLTIDAPTKYFVEIMDYFVKLMPDLGVVFADSSRIEDLYKNAIKMDVVDDDNSTMNYIEFVVGVGIKALEQQGVLEK